MMRSPALTDESGFTLVEVLVAATILIVGVFGSVTLVDGANRTTVSTRAREGATNLARELVEDARSIPYEDVTPALVDDRLRAKPGLDADPSSSTWTVVRRGITYTVAMDACSVDDPDDGTGPRPQGFTFCAGGAAAGTVDTDPEDYKRVTVDVRWTRGSGSRLVRQTGVVPNPGNAAGVGIASIDGPTEITGDLASFEVATTRPAASLEWFVDGLPRGTLTGPATGFQLSWPVDLCDGAHVVSAQAYDQFGRSAGPRSLTVRVNRGNPCPDSGQPPPPDGGPEGNRPPTAPTSLTAKGRGKFVDLSWGASSDPDAGDSVKDYRVYRDGVLFHTTTATSYTDASKDGKPHTYWVTAVDTRAAESERSNSVDHVPPGYTP